MKALYVDHTIWTETAPLDAGGWGVTVNVIRPDGAVGVVGLGRALRFATSDLAHQRGLTLGCLWVDRHGRSGSCSSRHTAGSSSKIGAEGRFP